MLASDSAIQREVLQSLYSDVLARVKSEPKNWWQVSDVARSYVNYLTKPSFGAQKRKFSRLWD